MTTRTENLAGGRVQLVAVCDRCNDSVAFVVLHDGRQVVTLRRPGQRAVVPVVDGVQTVRCSGCRPTLEDHWVGHVLRRDELIAAAAGWAGGRPLELRLALRAIPAHP